MKHALNAPTEHAAQPSILRELFGIDPRSMALLRFSMGLIIIIDLIDRARSLTMHYSDLGILPSSVVQERLNDLLIWFSIYFYIDHSPPLLAALFILQGLFAALLLIGWRTRLMTIICWYLLASLHARNTILLHSGDRLLLILLFWSAFLPMGARWSVDSAMNTRRDRLPPDNLHVSAATVAALFQIVFVYIFAIGARITPEAVRGEGFLDWWKGRAVYYVMHMDLMGTPLAGWLRQHRGLMILMTYATLAIEIFGPILAFFPAAVGVIRLLVIAMFAGMHLGFGTFIYIGTFAPIDIMAWFLFLPPLFWNTILNLLSTDRRRGLRIYYDDTCGFCKKAVRLIHSFLLIPVTRVSPAQDDDAIHQIMIERNSWVVVDHDQSRHTGFDALLVVLRRSPLAFWVGWLLSIPPLPMIGEAIYRYVANHRHGAGWLVAWAKPRPVRMRLPLGVSVAVSFLLVYVFLWNVSQLPWPGVWVALPDTAKIPGKMLRLDQYWGMFSPQPNHRDNWFVFQGTLADGSAIEINTGRPYDLDEKPAFVPDLYGHYRTLIYLFLSDEPGNWGLFEHYARYLVERWNASHEPSRHVRHVEVYQIVEMTKWDHIAPLRAMKIVQYDVQSDAAVISGWSDVTGPVVPDPPWQSRDGS